MRNIENIVMEEQEDEIVFTAVKTSKVRNLQSEVVEKEEKEEIARIPNNRKAGYEIGEALVKRFVEKEDGRKLAKHLQKKFGKV